MASAGRILIMPKGNYDPSVTYEMLDMVHYNGTSWLAKRTVSNIEPSAANSEYWHNLVDVTPESIGAVQRDVWLFTSTANDSLFNYVKTKIGEGYTSGVIQVNASAGIADVPQEILSGVGTYFLCVFQKHYYEYVSVTLCGDSSLCEYSNKASLVQNNTWPDTWTERLNPNGYLPKSGGTLKGRLFLGNGSGSLGSSTDGTYIESRTDDSNYRGIVIDSQSTEEDVSSSLKFVDSVNNNSHEYKIFGEHNIDYLKQLLGLA